MDQPNYLAKWWHTEDDGIHCDLCPRCCHIAEGKCGFCGVRQNIGGQLFSVAYGYPEALQIDPIEKKPLRHFLPGTRTFSVGSFGCNLGCIFCQNDHLSRATYNPRARYRHFSPAELVELTQRHGCKSISFTYNEPTVWAEYIIETFKLAHEAGLKNILVTNGFINRKAAEELYPLADAANVDVKGFSDGFYGEMCHAILKPVTDSCEYFKNELGKHLEITNLVIPDKNSSKEMVSALLDWVESKLGVDTPVHFTAYHPAYRYNASPRTPIGMLRDIQAYAVERGFTRVYLGNIC